MMIYICMYLREGAGAAGARAGCAGPAGAARPARRLAPRGPASASAPLVPPPRSVHKQFLHSLKITGKYAFRNLYFFYSKLNHT